jgi:glycosyl transferase family 61
MSSPFISTLEPKVVSANGAFTSRFEILTRHQVSDRNKAFLHTTHHTLGAIYRSDGYIINMSTRSGGHHGDHVTALDREVLKFSQCDVSNWQRISGNTIYLGNFMNHYGHFITESLSRMWYLFDNLDSAKFDNYAYFPFTFDDGRVIISPFHRHFLERFRIPPDKLLFLSEPVVFDKVVIPQQLWVVNKFCYGQLRPLYAAVRKEHEKRADFGRIFLSRTTPRRDRFVNISEVENLFASFGFEVLYPQRMDIGQQLDAYANCKIMAGFSGTALHNCLFSNANTFLIEVCDMRCPGAPVPMQLICNDLAQVSGTHIPYLESEAGGVDIHAMEVRLNEILDRIAGAKLS